MGESAVGIGHLVHVFTLFNCGTLPIVCINQLGGDAILHAHSFAGAAGGNQPHSSQVVLALAFNLTASGLMTAATALPGAVAMVASFAGMFIGQAVRSRMQPDVFRPWFLIAMILLGVYLAGTALGRIHG